MLSSFLNMAHLGKGYPPAGRWRAGRVALSNDGTFTVKSGTSACWPRSEATCSPLCESPVKPLLDNAYEDLQKVPAVGDSISVSAQRCVPSAASKHGTFGKHTGGGGACSPDRDLLSNGGTFETGTARRFYQQAPDLSQWSATQYPKPLLDKAFQSMRDRSAFRPRPF